jgi:ArsR family transcriptional regulator, lead/cadmium/zinc/bismuth-responsive transcriptional repressor
MARPRKSDQLAIATDLVCEDRVVHIDAVRAARARLPEQASLRGMAELFATFGDPTRLRILAALSGGELCVCDLAATVGQSDSAVSHQLRLLRGLGLVRSRRDGRLVYYALDDDHIDTLYRQALEHVAHREPEVGP